LETQRTPNRLIHEKSPYLLQHAYNPVDWHAWGELAFETARKENKPIFLSIGYSTCHWCHVMERESFENEEIAKFLNECFVPVKVDREERPDIDQIYMTSVQAMTGSGGWPMSVFLTHDLKPFYAGTYFPPEDRWGRPGFLTVLSAIHEKWKSGREELIQSSESITRSIFDVSHRQTTQTSLDENILKEAFEQLYGQFDSEYGGFGGAPKFPRSSAIEVLLRWWKRSGDGRSRKIAQKTLEEMGKGGIYDHLGGGFHRYSVDQQWRIPHFEKMLYDQALISKSYLDAFQDSRHDFFGKTAREILDYVLRDMTAEFGGFYSAEDADSAEHAENPHEKKEGAFYLWTVPEIVQHLGQEKAAFFMDYYGIFPDGNALHDPHGEFVGKNVLFISQDLSAAAAKHGITAEQASKWIENGREILLRQRALRPRPYLDDKVLTDWNSLMISSLARGSRVLKEERYLDAAKKAACFILEKMVSPKGRLMHRYRDGETSVPAFLDDYAFLIHALLDLYEACFETKFLRKAESLMRDMLRLFWDEKESGFFFTGIDAEKMIVRNKEIYDGAVPSGNAVAVFVLLRLSRMLQNSDFEGFARRTLAFFSPQTAHYPSAHAQLLIALDFTLGPPIEIVLAGLLESPEIQEMMDEMDQRFFPNKILMLNTGEDDIVSLAPYLKDKIPLAGKPSLYLCQNYACQKPISSRQELSDILSKE
jgi:uncharacterized protein YyaL (SSP411 family)